MERRRYSEGLQGDSAPIISYRLDTDLTPLETMRKKRRELNIVPNGLTLSTTSDARKCFVERHFSKSMQEFMINYAYTLVNTKVLSGEV